MLEKINGDKNLAATVKRSKLTDPFFVRLWTMFDVGPTPIDLGIAKYYLEISSNDFSRFVGIIAAVLPVTAI